MRLLHDGRDDNDRKFSEASKANQKLGYFHIENQKKGAYLMNSQEPYSNLIESTEVPITDAMMRGPR